MPTVRFIGRVLPAAIDVSIPNEPEFTWTSDDLGLDMTFRLQIQKNSVIVDCDVNTFIDPAGATLPLAAHKPSLTALASAVKPGTRDFDKLLQVVLAEPALFVALHDLVEAITAPHHAAFHCARAIAGMRSLFVALGGSPDSRWATLRDKLQVSKSYLQAITNPTAATEGQPMHM